MVQTKGWSEDTGVGWALIALRDNAAAGRVHAGRMDTRSKTPSLKYRVGAYSMWQRHRR